VPAARVCTRPPDLIDHLVRLRLYIKRNGDAERFGRLQIEVARLVQSFQASPPRGNRCVPPARLVRRTGDRPHETSAEKWKGIPPPHSITSSARDSSPGDRWSPSAFAVLRLISSSNLVG